MSSKRKQNYDAEFKCSVIKKAEEIGNRAAARQFGISECNIRRWRVSKPAILNMPKKKKTLACTPPKWPELETSLALWVTAQREEGQPISTVLLRLKAKELAKARNLDDFLGTPSWCQRFMKRHNLSIRAKTSVGQKLPNDWQEKQENFHKFVKNIIEKGCIPHTLIVNMDEVPLTFDAPPNRTIDSKGVKTVFVKTTGHEKSYFTVVLGCAADGSKLKPMVIFKRKTIPKEHFPVGVVVKANEKGWMRENLMLAWLEEIYLDESQDRSVLVLDSMAAHVCSSVKDVCSNRNISLAVIPGGLTKKLQPLDLTINRVFKTEIRRLWEQWMSGDLHEYTKAGNMKKASCAEVCQWVDFAWKAVKQSTIIKAFQSAGIIPKSVPTPPSEASTSAAEVSYDSSDNSESHDDNAEINVDDNLLSLFNSETEESDFDGFTDEQDILQLFCSDSDESDFQGFEAESEKENEK